MLLFTKNSFQLNNCLRMFARNIITYALRTTRSTAPKISQPPNLKVFQAIKAKQPAKVKLTPQLIQRRYKYYRCDGCDTILQSESKAKFGYIDKQTMEQSLRKNSEIIQNSYGMKALRQDNKVLSLLHQVENELGINIFNAKSPRLQNLDQIEVLLRLQQKIDEHEQESQPIQRSNKQRKQLLCYRCYNLKYHNRLPDQYDIEQPNSQQLILSKLFKKHHHLPTHYLYLVDVLDLSGSFQQSVFIRLIKQNVPFSIVINKLDIVNMKYLMKEMIPMLVRARMMEFCHKNKVELDRKAIKIFVISCISKDGVKKLIEFLDETGMKRIQLLGFPNTGKTTLLNELAKINKPTSKVPGTTVHITQHRDLKKRLIYDMPGIHSDKNMYNLISKPNLRSLLTWNKHYSPPIMANSATFYGGKVEIEGSKIILFGLGGACSSDNRWFLSNRAEFWKGLPQPHELQMTRYEHTLKFVNGKADDLEIAGYGFICFRLQKPNCKGETVKRLVLYLPRNIAYRFRPSMLRDDKIIYLKSVRTKRHMLNRVHKQKHKKYMTN